MRKIDILFDIIKNSKIVLIPLTINFLCLLMLIFDIITNFSYHIPILTYFVYLLSSILLVISLVVILYKDWNKNKQIA